MCSIFIHQNWNSSFTGKLPTVSIHDQLSKQTAPPINIIRLLIYYQLSKKTVPRRDIIRRLYITSVPVPS